MSSPSIAIVTVTYNAADFINDYLTSLEQILRARPSVRLFLVDNASSDDCVALMGASKLKADFPGRVTILPQSGNLGFGRGCNAGADAALAEGVDFLWFLNPDTVASVDALDALLSTFEAQEEAAFVGSALTNESGELRTGAFRFPTALTSFVAESALGLISRLFPEHSSALRLEGSAYRADWLTGASFMVRAAAFQRLEGFDPRYFLYFEEVDLFLRAQREGLSAWSCPQSQVFHISGASTGINQKNVAARPKKMPKYWFESRRYFYVKNFGRPYAALADLSFLVAHLIRRVKGAASRKTPTRVGLLGGVVRHNALFSRG